MCRFWLYGKAAKGVWKIANCETAFRLLWKLLPLFEELSKDVWLYANCFVTRSTSSEKSDSVRTLYSNVWPCAVAMWDFSLPRFMARISKRWAICEKVRGISADV